MRSVRAACVGAVAFAAVCVPSGAAADPHHWTLRPADSTLGFRVLVQDQTLSGSFSRFDGRVETDRESGHPTSISVTVDVGSVGIDGGQSEQAAKSDLWLGTVMFPSATYVSDTVVPTGAGSFHSNGHLTLKGMSHPVVLTFDLVLSGDTARSTGEAVIARGAFGVGPAPSGTIPVEDSVTVVFDIGAAKTPP